MKKYKKGDRKIYEDIYEGLSYYQTVGEVYHTQRSKQKFQRFLSEELVGIKNPRVLDIGCYIGTELFMLPKANPNIKYWGVDVSSGAIDYAKKLAIKRGEKNITFKAIDANQPFPFPKNYFDAIYALELIEHLHEPQKFLVEVLRILKPRGTLILSSPNKKTPLASLISFFPKLLRSWNKVREQDFSRHGNAFKVDSSVWDNEAHISLHNFNEWKPIFKKGGFKIESVEGSSIYGGSRVIGDNPLLLGLIILMDAFIDKIPVKPYLQMCFVVKLKKDV